MEDDSYLIKTFSGRDLEEVCVSSGLGLLNKRIWMIFEVLGEVRKTNCKKRNRYGEIHIGAEIRLNKA